MNWAEAISNIAISIIKMNNTQLLYFLVTIVAVFTMIANLKNIGKWCDVAFFYVFRKIPEKIKKRKSLSQFSKKLKKLNKWQLGRIREAIVSLGSPYSGKCCSAFRVHKQKAKNMEHLVNLNIFRITEDETTSRDYELQNPHLLWAEYHYNGFNKYLILLKDE